MVPLSQTLAVDLPPLFTASPALVRPFLFLSFFLFFFFFFVFSRAVPMACGGSQARIIIRAAAAGLRYSHSNARSEPRLQPTPQLTATPDP